MKTIKQHLSELPEPYNWLALEDVEKFGIVTTTTVAKQSTAVSCITLFFYLSPLGFSTDFIDFYEGLHDNLQHLNK